MPADIEPRVVLVGMMGSGKSTVGRLLAAATGWSLHDNDAALQELVGMTASELLVQRGEAALRQAEEEALLVALGRPEPQVIDAAGGTIGSSRVRGLLLDERVVYLRATVDTLVVRAAGGDHRPWLDRGREWFVTKAAEREPLFEAVADLVVDTDDRSAEDTAAEILVWLEAVLKDGGDS